MTPNKQSLTDKLTKHFPLGTPISIQSEVLDDPIRGHYHVAEVRNDATVFVQPEYGGSVLSRLIVTPHEDGTYTGVSASTGHSGLTVSITNQDDKNYQDNQRMEFVKKSIPAGTKLVQPSQMDSGELEGHFIEVKGHYHDHKTDEMGLLYNDNQSPQLQQLPVLSLTQHNKQVLMNDQPTKVVKYTLE